MVKVYCADTTCKYNKEGICKNKEIHLNYECINTVNQGRREFNTCKDKVESEEYKEMKHKILEAMLKNYDNK